MVPVILTERVGEDGTLRLVIGGLEPRRRVRVTVVDDEEPDHETADSNPDVEDFA